MMILVAIVNFTVTRVITKVQWLSPQYSAVLTNHVGLLPPRTLVWQPHCGASLIAVPLALHVSHTLVAHP